MYTQKSTSKKYQFSFLCLEQRLVMGISVFCVVRVFTQKQANFYENK